MKTDVRLRRDQPDRLRVRDEVDLVSALGKFQPELGGYNATAAICRVTGDAYLHEGLSVRFMQFNDWMSFSYLRFTIGYTRSARHLGRQESAARHPTSTLRVRGHATRAAAFVCRLIPDRCTQD